MKNDIIMIVKSWATSYSVSNYEDILNWVNEKNSNLRVVINKIDLKDSKDWKLKKGLIERNGGSFFSVVGIKSIVDNELIEQPIIIQNEIGYLGIICKEINGTLHFLMQAKIEPGNVNKIQISPTIQATKSNFTQVHGGKKPAYLDYFINASKYEIIVDQIQSEQSSRFLKKRNRNIIIKVDEDIELLDSHKWMTLNQIKKLMKIDNLVNMDTRTVLSCIPYCEIDDYEAVRNYFSDEALCKSMFNNDDSNLQKIYRAINDYKMFKNVNYVLCRLDELKSWHFHNHEFVCKNHYPFKVVFCDIQIEGREVKRWTQPLFEANGMAIFALFTKIINDRRLFLVTLKPEIGSFDKLELGPTIQREAGQKYKNEVEDLFDVLYTNKKNILLEVTLSEEGGRFYHEQNKNVIIELDDNELTDLPSGYFWVDYRTLNQMVLINNTLNIQLRNLLSLLEN